jgi:hypothetical protein
MTGANLVVKEVFVNIQCKSEQRKQTSSQGDHGMAVVETSNQTSGREQGDGRGILIVHHIVLEAGQLFWPDVLSIQASFIPKRRRDGVLPTNVKTFMEIPSVLRIGVLS